MDQNDALHKERMAALLRTTKYVKHDNVPAKIEEGLYLGSVGAANNKTLLTSFNVTHILTVANSLPPAYPNDFTYKIVKVSDRKEVNIAHFFDDCFNFINQGKQMGGVLVHCFVGRSRSVTVVLAYLMKKHGMSLSEAVNLVKSKRSVASPNSGFMLQLQKYEKCLRVMGIHDFLCLPEWTGAEVQEEPHHDIRPTLQRLPCYCTPLAAVGAAIPEPTLKDLAAGTPSAKVMAKAESSNKRKALLSGVAPSHVAKRTTSVMAQSSGSTTRPSLFSADSEEESDDDEDACVEIPLITPIRSVAVIPTDGNQSGGSAASADEGLSIRDSRGKAVMTDVDGRSRPGPASSFRDVSGDATRRDFPFFAGPYYATYPEGGIAGSELSREEWDTIMTKEVFKDPSVCKTVVDQFPTPGEMVQIEALTDDQLTAKMSGLHCLMMSHGGELLARYRGLLKSHHDYVQSADSRLKGFEERCAALQGLESQVSDFQKRVVDLNDKLSTSDAAFAKAKSKGEERKNKIKSLTKNLDRLNAEVARLSAALNQAIVLEAEKDEEILRLKASHPEFASFFRSGFQSLVRKFLASDEFSRVQGELLSLAASVGFERGLSMHRTQEEFATVLKKISHSHFVPGAQDRLAEASPLVAQTEYSFLNKISDHAADPLSVILQLEPEKLARPKGVPPPQGTHVSPPVAKESIVTPVSSSLELPSNDAPSSSAVVLGQNEEWINAMVDTPDNEIVDGAGKDKSGEVFVQGVSYVVPGSERVSSDPNDVVVTLSAEEKDSGSLPPSSVVEKAASAPSGV